MDGRGIPTVVSRCGTGTSTEIPRKRSMYRSVPRTHSTLGQVIKASRRTSTRDEDGGDSKSSSPRIGLERNGWCGHLQTEAERIAPRGRCSRNGKRTNYAFLQVPLLTLS